MMNVTLSTEAAKMVGLSDKARQDALDAARAKIAGPKVIPPAPTLQDYEKRKTSKYPPAVSNTIYALCVLMLAAAFLPSAMRLHAVGVGAFEDVITDAFSVYLAALCFVLMAETGQVIFTLASAVASGVWMRAGLFAGSLICTLIALSGNALAVQQAHALKEAADAAPASTDTIALAFAFLETYAPPLLVLVVSSILKSLIMGAIKTHHDARIKFEDAYAGWLLSKTQTENAWSEAHANAHLHHSWMRVSAGALKEAVRRANAARTTVLTKLDDADWYALVHRELNADAWYERSQVSTQPAIEKQVTGHVLRSSPARKLRVSPAGGAAGKHTGELRDSIKQNADGSFTGVCPRCGKVETRESAASVRGALQAHIRHQHPKPAAV